MVENVVYLTLLVLVLGLAMGLALHLFYLLPASWKRSLQVLLAVSGFVALLLWALESLGGVRPVRMGVIP